MAIPKTEARRSRFSSLPPAAGAFVPAAGFLEVAPPAFAKPFAEPAMPTLADLHRRYTGPVPEEERAAVKAGGAERLARLRARGRLHFWRQQVTWALAAVRVYRLAVAEGRRRPDHEFYSRLMSDVQLAWRQYRAHVRAARDLESRLSPGVALMRDFGRALLNEAAE